MRIGIRSVVKQAVAVGFAALSASAPVAAYQEQEFRAADGTTYQVLRAVPPLGAGADRARITTVAGSSSGVGACSLTTSLASAVAGVLPPTQALHAFSQIKRTAVLVPNDVTQIGFDGSGGGHVTIGSGGGAVNVCRVGADCPGGSAGLVSLTTADADVPAACIANGVQASCDGTNSRNTIAFGLAASGSPPVCNNPAAVTVNTSVCAAEPADGFAIDAGEAIVFVYNGQLFGIGFDVGAGGFGIDSNASGSVCTSGGVVTAIARLDSDPGPGPAEPPPDAAAPALSPSLAALLVAVLAVWGAYHLRDAQARPRR